MDDKSIKYLSNNLIVDEFIKNLKSKYGRNYEITVGSKFIRIMNGTTVWGFISRFDGMFKGYMVRKGDLMMAATHKAPAKHSRGNIIDGTASYDKYGPNYLR